jgi:hypothetical protein
MPHRSCAQQLVVAVAEAFEDSGALPAVLEGVVRRWAEADADAAAGKPCWWQMREAGMVAASSCEATVSLGEPVWGISLNMLGRFGMTELRGLAGQLSRCRWPGLFVEGRLENSVVFAVMLGPTGRQALAALHCQVHCFNQTQYKHCPCH